MASGWTWSAPHNDYYKFEARSTPGPRGRPQYDLIWARRDVPDPAPPPDEEAARPPSIPSTEPYIESGDRQYQVIPPGTTRSILGQRRNSDSIPRSPTVGGPSPPRRPDVLHDESKHKRLRRNVGANILLYDPGPDPVYQKIQKNDKFFKKGRIFAIVWPEPWGESMTDTATNGSSSTQSLQTSYQLVGHDTWESTTGNNANDLRTDGEQKLSQIHIKVRRFVVYRYRGMHCICLPIYTYSRQGTSKAGINPEEHAPLVKDGTEVVFHPKEEPEKLKERLTFIVEDHDVEWDPLSRIHFGKPMSIECNLKVRRLGRLDHASKILLDTHFRDCVLGFAEE